MKTEEIIEEAKKGATVKIIRMRTESYLMNKTNGDTVILKKNSARAAIKQLVPTSHTISSITYSFPKQ